MYCPYRSCFFFNNCLSCFANGMYRQLSPVTVQSRDVVENKKYIAVHLRIPVLSGSFNKQKVNHINKAIEDDILEFREQVEDGAKNDWEKLQTEGKTMQPYEASNIYEIGYNRNGLVSVEILYHVLLNNKNDYVKTGYTYDLTTGKSMSIGDLFKPGINYVAILNNQIRQELSVNKQKYLPETAAKFTGISQDQPFYLEDGDLILYFGFNEVAPVSADIPTIRIPLSRLRNFLIPRLQA